MTKWRYSPPWTDSDNKDVPGWQLDGGEFYVYKFDVCKYVVFGTGKRSKEIRKEFKTLQEALSFGDTMNALLQVETGGNNKGN